MKKKHSPKITSRHRNVRKTVKTSKRKTAFILWFDELGISDVPLVGGKNASLGEMYRKLTVKGVKIPNGFAVTSHAYFHFIREAGLMKEIRKILKNIDTHDVTDLARRGKAVRTLILNAPFPKDLEEEITKAYRQFCKHEKIANIDTAVRSSATAEDLPDASFAGQQETFLNIRGEKDILTACRKCFASLFTNRAISYREDKGFDHFTIGLSVAVQRMVRSDKATSGVMFSIDTETGFSGTVYINAVYGLGEYIVQGMVNPDEFTVFKPMLAKGFKPIIRRKIGSKKRKLIYNSKGTKTTVNAKVSLPEQQRFCISDEEALTLARWAMIIEDHYQKPMDMEWAKDGRTGELFIVQARPETVQSMKKRDVLEEYILKKKGKVLTSGSPVGRKIGTGNARVIMDAKDMVKFRPGEVLVTDITDPDWEPIMKIASAIVTDKGGRTSHAAIVSRELGIPAVVGCNNATDRISTSTAVTVSCTEGDTGNVYKGILPFRVKKTNIKNLKKPKTKIMMNVGTPEMALDVCQIPNDGVGLAREEFIITESVGVHPLALLNYRKQPKDIKRKIDRLTAGYPSPRDYYVMKLEEGISTIAAAFYPKDVILRFSDFKSNEYATLIGGEKYEPKEENPMIGWRGASRYYDEKFEPAFALECEAVHNVRTKMGLTNLKVMIPFCRTIEEGKRVLKVMEKNRLKRGKDGLEVYVMCEIPSNVLLADEFAQIFDGFSIGSNDLTQLTLGVDRDSALVSHVYDERNGAVKKMIATVIAVAKKHKRKIGICGQAPSDFPDFATFLVEQGIDSISLNPDTVLKTTMKILKKEQMLKRKRKRT
ncbi:phosphoenolpyruvate synthase [Patescibacteria group bacterium]|nr:phosphoenolpyruvate synthase [Patescibacteria group bacterium]MBU2259348.1 phosphoenolpyruvate synthase [Patescibacteria group bacterium]